MSNVTYIIEVRKDPEDRIIQVKTNDNKIYSKSYIIDLIKNDHIVKTAYKPNQNDSKYTEGANVEVYKSSNGVEYLRTKVNATRSDNLDNLPTF